MRSHLAVLAIALAAPAAAAPPRCDTAGAPGGFTAEVDAKHSSASPDGTSVVCNYCVRSQAKDPSLSGLAITLESGCPADVQQSWEGKTASRRRTEVERGGDRLLLREEKETDGYCGTHSVAEKAFLRLGPTRIATIVVLTDFREDPSDPSRYTTVPELSASAAYGMAAALSGAHPPQLRCAGGTAQTGVTVELLDMAPTYRQADDFPVRGRVTRDGQPVSGARVDLSLTSPRGTDYGSARLKPLTTGADGGFTWKGWFTADAAAGRWSLKATARDGTDTGEAQHEWTLEELPVDPDVVQERIKRITELWEASPVVPEGTQFDFINNLWPPKGPLVNIRSIFDSRFDPFRCSNYAIATLAFLNGLRFSESRSERLLLSGVAYGPITDGLGLIHVAVGLYPAANTLRGWRSGIVLDPWPNQTKEPWTWGAWTVKFLGGSEPERFWNFGNEWKGEYPTSGSDGGYYPGRAVNTGLALPGGASVITYSPVEDVVTDAAGRRVGRLLDGAFVNEVPGAQHTRYLKDDGTAVNLFLLPAGRYEVNVRGTGSGTFRLATASPAGGIEYPEQAIAAGQVVRLTLDPASAQPLRLPDGRTVAPAVMAAVAGNDRPPASAAASPSPGATVQAPTPRHDLLAFLPSRVLLGLVVMGFLGAVLSFVGLLVVLVRR